MTQQEEIESWARLYKRTYGDRARDEALRTSKERQLSGDKDGADKWRTISQRL
ncbi:MAG: hypothetical protein RIB45_04460 [Marivibrio sp.]|uniref:hypothetical protein n=1 Tax=Marivibrio sp. TaxID=2039719 RepID=UPI0032F095CE